MRIRVTGLAAKLEVADRVAAAVGKPDAVMDLQAAAGTAADAGLVAFVDARTDLAPRPAVSNPASCPPIVVPACADLAT